MTYQVPLVIEVWIIESKIVVSSHDWNGVLGGNSSTNGAVSLVNRFVSEMSDWQLRLFVMYDPALRPTQ